MISDRETNKIFFANRLKVDFPQTCIEIEAIVNSFNIKPDFLPKTKDIWARDFMPIQINDKKFLEYRYDPDYLQGSWKDKKTREIKTYPDIVCDEINLKTSKTDIVLDGGNVVKSTKSIILTDKVILENSLTYGKTKLLDKLHTFLKLIKSF